MPPYIYRGDRLVLKDSENREHVISAGDPVESLFHPRLENCWKNGDLIDTAPTSPAPAENVSVVKPEPELEQDEEKSQDDITTLEMETQPRRRRKR